MKPENFRGSFVVDLGRTRTYPYPQRFWSDTRRRAFFELFDEEVNDWQESVTDGKLVPGWMNEHLKPRSPGTLYEKLAAYHAEAAAAWHMNTYPEQLSPASAQTDIGNEPQHDQPVS